MCMAKLKATQPPCSLRKAGAGPKAGARPMHVVEPEATQQPPCSPRKPAGPGSSQLKQVEGLCMWLTPRPLMISVKLKLSLSAGSAPGLSLQSCLVTRLMFWYALFSHLALVTSGYCYSSTDKAISKKKGGGYCMEGKTHFMNTTCFVALF